MWWIKFDAVAVGCDELEDERLIIGLFGAKLLRSVAMTRLAALSETLSTVGFAIATELNVKYEEENKSDIFGVDELLWDEKDHCWVNKVKYKAVVIDCDGLTGWGMS